MMKKGFLLITLVLAGLLLAGCSGLGQQKDLKVALAMTGAKTDGGWNETAYNGLLLIEKELGATIAYSEFVKATDYERVLRDYAKDGNNVVIGHGYEFSDAALAVGKEFPDVQFIVTSTDITNNDNVGSLNNNYLQAGFLQGAFAALMTKTNVIGGVGGMAIPPISNDLKGYEAGAKYINPGIKVLTAMTGNFDDANAVKEQSLTFISQGADIIMVDADHAGIGGYVAAEEKGIYAIASIAAEYDSYQKGLIACGTADMAKAISEAVADIADDDNYKASFRLMGVKEGIVDFTFSKYLKAKVPADVIKKIDAIKADLESGKIDVVALTK